MDWHILTLCEALSGSNRLYHKILLRSKSGNLGLELYRFFPYVRMGRWNRDILELPDAFLYFICVHLNDRIS